MEPWSLAVLVVMWKSHCSSFSAGPCCSSFCLAWFPCPSSPWPRGPAGRLALDLVVGRFAPLPPLLLHQQHDHLVAVLVAGVWLLPRFSWRCSMFVISCPLYSCPFQEKQEAAMELDQPREELEVTADDARAWEATDDDAEEEL